MIQAYQSGTRQLCPAAENPNYLYRVCVPGYANRLLLHVAIAQYDSRMNSGASFLYWTIGLCLVSGVAKGASFDHSYTNFARVLETRVQDGNVDYAALQKDRQELEAFLRLVGSVTENDYAAWSREQKLAFLINSYNAAVLQLVADNYPVSSIKRIGGWFSNPFSTKFVSLFGRKVSLDDIEHGMLRPDFREPRIHFALVCAAKSCPTLRREPYTAEKLNQQLDDQARLFLNDQSKNRVDADSRTIYLSSIFKWFGEDFGPDQNAVIGSVGKYWPSAAQAANASPPFKVRYLDYDWKLNDRKR